MAEQRSTVDPAEVERFARLAEEWWDPAGKFKPLHRFNPTRLGFIRDRMAARFGRDIAGTSPFGGLSLVDIGCGGGLVAEPMARLGFSVTGLDAVTQTIHTAEAHAAQAGLSIDYRATTAEALHAEGRRFDVVLALEVVEHVADLPAFLATAAGLVAPGGALIVSTINRTAKAFALAIIGAEYVLGWVPRGTHTWSKFVRPSELVAGLAPHGLAIEELTGTAYHPLTDSWHLAPRDLDVNYMLLATRPA
ncbi:MAG TPA: bifunctional 2-polyprenyl-6-hydroxyphenol methylase/3-demethylubiquinol 3-O-methyltransferase UbiG [Stellaceae bacterium]|nr:bifunctional 2-polyprenyl-6-hydroxyphenol methylase/3-demethylubiquinol 3-O-methyltransferase UbiG [Stellaceae bacterium]